MNAGKYSSRLEGFAWPACEEPELLTDIHDFTTLSYVNLRCKSFKWLDESSIESDLGTQFAIIIWSLDLAIHDFSFFKHVSKLVEEQVMKKSILLIFVIWENQIFISVILYFFRLWTVPETPLYDPR